MTDIVERLRRVAGLGLINGGLMDDAAKEIEQLRAAHAAVGHELENADAEIERLREALQDIAIGVGESVLSQEDMRARAFDGLNRS